ncbi:MAG: hypothetical protein HY835_06940 [Anaerolineae bacterium]|nr:hypothetical protein [Anaerolineae bacterium]
MSIEVMNLVWTQSEQKGSSLLLLLAIADNANNKGEAYPGIDYLSRKVRMSRRQTQRLVQELERTNELAVIWGGSGPKDAHFYYILVGKGPEDIQTAKEKVAKINAKRGKTVAARKNDTGEPAQDMGDNLSPLDALDETLDKGDNLTPSMETEEKSDILSPLPDDPEKGVKPGDKGDISGKKGVKSSKKGDIAVSPEPLINRERNRQGEPGARNEISPTENGHSPARPTDPLAGDPNHIPAEVQLIKSVTERMPRRDQWPLIVRAWKGKPHSREFLLPFWEAWVARDHKRTSLGWLDWAAQGAIPEPWAKKPPRPEQTNEPKGFESIRKVLREHQNGSL